MTRSIGITGAAGFFGWHLRCRLVTLGIQFVTADRQTFTSPESIDRFLRSSDVVIHLAGVNRAASDSEIVHGNVQLAQELIDACERTGLAPDIVYANSVKADEAGPYGESKAEAASMLAANAKARGSRFVDIRFPHLYGEFGTPFYNSAVTTFAHQLARGEDSTVSDGTLELLHVQDACQQVVDAITKELDEPVRLVGRRISVSDCYATMKRLALPYIAAGTIPLLQDDVLELRLFNTIRSQMWPSAYPMQLTLHSDARGAFFEVVRAFGQGQTSISTTRPGIRRGEHYHLNKIERFVVVSGSAEIRVRRLFSREVETFGVSGEEPAVIDMPPLCTHDITNTGDGDLVTLFWSHDHFDPMNTDTYPLALVGEDLPA